MSFSKTFLLSWAGKMHFRFVFVCFMVSLNSFLQIILKNWVYYWMTHLCARFTVVRYPVNINWPFTWSTFVPYMSVTTFMFSSSSSSFLFLLEVVDVWLLTFSACYISVWLDILFKMFQICLSKCSMLHVLFLTLVDFWLVVR